MTNKDAISLIKPIADSSMNADRIGLFEPKPITTALYMAIDALEKQIAKKPRITHLEYLYNGEEKTADLTHCPICFEHMGYFDSLLNKWVSYCDRCGQAIDWSDE